MISMSTNTKISKSTQLTRDQQMLAGIEKHSTTVTSWLIAGTTYTAQQAMDLLQARIDAALAVTTAKAAYRNTVQAADTETASTKQVVAGLRAATYIMFSAQVDGLADFGLTPHKSRATLTVVEKVQAVELRKATRVVRHTMSKKAKEEIKGTAHVTVTVTTPATSVPAVAAQPVILAANPLPHGASTPQGS
jgi:hypothetical protein